MNALRSFLAEPAEPNPPQRVWRDWVLVALLIGFALVEGITREELVWRQLSVPLHLIPIVMMLWRRTHPLLSVAVTWTVITGLDIAAIAVERDSPGLVTMVGLIVYPYALFRWGSGRDAVIGLLIMNVMNVTNMIYYPSGPELTTFSFAWLLLPSSLGAAVRFRDRAQTNAVNEAKMFEREQLARELHDTIAHRVSAIAIQAEAGFTLMSSDPEASASTLKAIKEEASRTLTEMRSIVGMLRQGEDEPSPQKRIGDLQRLAANGVQQPPIEIEVLGEFDDVAPSIQTAVFRIAQEASTNARRHARRATRISIRVEEDDRDVTVTVADDGDASYVDPKSSSGYGLVGMNERASLHGGSLDAGPNRGRGWTVKAVLPKQGQSQ